MAAWTEAPVQPPAREMRGVTLLALSSGQAGT
jgi:hypothetical protein